MPVSRYSRTMRLDFGAQQGTSVSIESIRSAIASGQIRILSEIVVRGAERLDTIAGDVYGDGRYWWILAAASDIGWGLQVPVGTIIRIPSLQDVLAIVA